MSTEVRLKSSPAKEVMRRLKRNGKMSVKELIESIGVTRTAVRQQLASLEAEGLIERVYIRSGVGRPSGIYSLSDEGHKLFAREYEPLLRILLEELEAAEDPSRVRALLNKVSRRLAEDYESLPHDGSLADRMAFLAEQLSSRGHLAEAEAVPEGYDLKMFNCPYRELVADHPAICEMERSMLNQLLGSKVKRHQCILDERNTYCSYTVVGPEGEATAAG